MFGPMLREARKRCGMPIWRVAATAPHHQGNLQRIERGITEPRVGLALRLLMAIGVDTGSFMENLAIKAGWRQHPGESHPPRADANAVVVRIADSKEDVIPFGPLLRRTRLVYGQSQKHLAEQAGYTVRNLINVENGRQEPGIMTALKLVCTTGCDVASFFNELAVRYTQGNAK